MEWNSSTVSDTSLIIKALFMKAICRRIDNRTLLETDGKTIRGSVNLDVSTEALYDGQLLCCLPLYADFDENKNAPGITGHIVQPVLYEDSSFTCHGWFRILGQNDIGDLLGVCIDENDIRKVTFRAKFEEPQ